MTGVCALHDKWARSEEHGVRYCLACFREAAGAEPETPVTGHTVKAMVQRLIAERERRRAADLRAVQRRLEGKPNG